MGTKNEVREFLESVKFVLQASAPNNPNWTISTIREKNLITLSKLELDSEDIKEILMSLIVEDFCEGPIKDKTIKGDLWVFGKKIKNTEIYIKLKLYGDANCSQLKVLSFHIADAPLKFKYV